MRGSGEVSIGTVVVRDGIVECRWHPGSLVDADDARDAMRASAQATGGKPVPALFHMTEVATTLAARDVFAQATQLTAVAVLGSSPVDRVRAAAMRRQLGYPHQFFTSRPKAEGWLQRFSCHPAAESLPPQAAEAPTPRTSRSGTRSRWEI